MRRALVVLALLPLDVAAAAWLVGFVCSDRWTWSQWLSWIPAPVAALALLVGAGLLAVARRRRGAHVHAGLAVLVLGWFVLGEHRFVQALAPAPARDPAHLRVMHWTLGESMEGRDDAFADAVLPHDPDVLVAIDAGAPARGPRMRAWMDDAGGTRRLLRPFAVLSKAPVRELSLVAKADGISVARLVVEHAVAPDGTLELLLVNLPSDPTLSRAATARRVRRWLDESGTPEPDVVIGDFNAERGAWSVRHLFPNHRHAFDEAGRGYGATFHRRLPLVHIDHVLLGPGVRAVRYAIPRPGVRRHDPQVVDLAPATD